MITIDKTLNELEVMIVAEHLESKGVENYTLTQGNDCIWVFYDRHNIYYTFKDGKIHDIQID